MNHPKLVMVTAGDANGRRLSQVLDRLGIECEILTVAHAPPRRGRKSLVAHLRSLVRAHVAAQPQLRAWQHRRRGPFARAPRYVGFCNGPAMKLALRSANPDYILMMGGGIIDGETIATARLGVLNVHPGLLPWIRGVDVIRHAVARDVPIGLTAHFIDQGIDTGDVIGRVKMRIRDGDTHETVAERADHMSVAFMAELARRLWAGETLERTQQTEKHPLCRALPPEDRAVLDARIAAGEARALFQRSPLAAELPSDDALMAAYDTWWPLRERF